MAVPGRLELPTFGLGNRCSIQLSYGTGRLYLARENPAQYERRLPSLEPSTVEHGQCGAAVSRLQFYEQRARILDVSLAAGVGGQLQRDRGRMIFAADEDQGFRQAPHRGLVENGFFHSLSFSSSQGFGELGGQFRLAQAKHRRVSPRARYPSAIAWAWRAARRPQNRRLEAVSEAGNRDEARARLFGVRAVCWLALAALANFAPDAARAEAWPACAGSNLSPTAHAAAGARDAAARRRPRSTARRRHRGERSRRRSRR